MRKKDDGVSRLNHTLPLARSSGNRRLIDTLILSLAAGKAGNLARRTMENIVLSAVDAREYSPVIPRGIQIQANPI
jgi:hypothetical protein